MENSEYWAKRFKTLEERSNVEAQKCISESMKLIDNAVVQIDKDITYWLKRFADNNNMTLAEAKKAITNKELKELGWDVEEYIRKGYANSYLGNWDKELENASAKYHITRLDAIKMQMVLFCDKAFADITENVTKTLSNVYNDVYYRTAFEVQKGIGVGFSFAQVDEKKLKTILEKPWASDGSNFSDRIWGTYRPKLTNKLQQALTDWCVRGTDPKKLARQLSYESGMAQSACNTLIRTETAQICTRAEMDSYDELGVEKYRVLETLDGKTCDMCAGMDSKIFNRNEFEIGITAPPFHPRCRGTTIPEVTDELLKQGRKRATRDENGKTIYVDDMLYTDWKEKFVSNDKFTSVNNDDIIKSIGASFRTVDDPMREVMGAAEQSHPDELADIMADLISNGVIIKYREGAMGYFPPALPGKPGNIVMEKGASFSAWSHEYKHFCDDRADGFLGLRVLSDPEKCAKREIDAYQVEIEIAKKLPKDVREEMIKRLEALRNEEVKRYV